MNVIRLLEEFGRNPLFRQRDYGKAIRLSEIEARQREALLALDIEGLNGLLGGRPVMSLHVIAPDGEEETKELPGEQEGGETPDERPQPAEESI